jgi:DNA processing protein
MAPAADAYWLALRHVRGVGPRTARLLLERFGSAEEVFRQNEGAIAAIGVPRPTALKIVRFTDFAPLERELCELSKIDGRLIRWTEQEYPVNLRQIADPPPFLFIRGTVAPSNPKCIAVVGARAASEAGRRMARRLGLELASKGFTVVSGLARGIDSEAHQGALDAAGRTVAILGCGIDYPPENRKLAESIIEAGGALLSELPIGTPPIAENFPGRNRLISGICAGVIVVEAAERSGSLITARAALDQNRQVFAVPGSPLTGKTRGSNRLIKDGARLVDCVEDVLEELLPQLGEPHVGILPTDNAAFCKSGIPQDGSEASEVKSILSLLKTADKIHVDGLIDASGLSAQTVLKLLLELELRGLVTQHPGKLFSLA